MVDDTTAASFFEDHLWHDLFSRVEHLWRYIEANTNPNCKLHQAFRNILEQGFTPHSHATFDDLTIALQAFDSIHPSSRQIILNGWALPADHRTYARWVGSFDGAVRVPHLVVEPDVAYAASLARDTTTSVMLCVTEGTPLSEVLSAVDKIRRTIVDRFDYLIEDPQGERVRGHLKRVEMLEV
jgi:hypothetical protein